MYNRGVFGGPLVRDWLASELARVGFVSATAGPSGVGVGRIPRQVRDILRSGTTPRRISLPSLPRPTWGNWVVDLLDRNHHYQHRYKYRSEAVPSPADWVKLDINVAGEEFVSTVKMQYTPNAPVKFALERRTKHAGTIDKILSCSRLGEFKEWFPNLPDVVRGEDPVAPPPTPLRKNLNSR